MRYPGLEDGRGIMNFDEALQAVREATDGTIAVEGEFPFAMSRFVISQDTATKWDSGRGSGRDREFTLYRPVKQWTVEAVVGKTFPYHEAVEIAKQLGNAVEFVCCGTESVPIPGAKAYLSAHRYICSIRAITEFTATVHSGSYDGANQLRVDLPPGAGIGNWVVTARRKV